MQDHLPFLSSLPLFRGIPAEELPALLSALHAARRETPAGTLLLRAGEAAGRAGRSFQAAPRSCMRMRSAAAASCTSWNRASCSARRSAWRGRPPRSA